MSRNICKKTILKVAGIAIFAVLFYTVCDDNSVNVVTPEVTTFEDKRDGKIYKKVQIGSQIWMAENLRYEADGSVCPANTDSNCEIYGRFYDWNTAMNGEHSSNSKPSGVEGVCPVGWHIPSDAEWTTLEDFVGINAGTKLKSREWHDRTAPSGKPNVDGTDKYRFTALPSGAGSHHNGKVSIIHHNWNGYWWTATEAESDETQAWNRVIMGSQTGITRARLDKHEYFLSVRCVHD